MNWHFARHPDIDQNFCHKLTLLAHFYNYYEVFNDIRFDPVIQGVLEILQVKVERLDFCQVNLNVSTFICRIFDIPWCIGSYTTSLEKSL